MWSDYLRGGQAEADWGWGAFGAAEFLTQIGCDIPQTPISAADLQRLEICAQRATEFGNMTSKQLKKAVEDLRPVAAEMSVWFRDNCNIDFDVDAEPTFFIEQAVPDVDTAVTIFQSEYGTVEGFFDSYGAFDTNQASNDNNYEAMDSRLDDNNLSDEEYAAAGEKPIDTEYWEPPPPEHFTNKFGSVE